MSQYEKGKPVKAVKVVHRSGGSAWPGTSGKVVDVKGDGLTIRWADGHIAESVKDHEVEPG
jgi:hypothetical protein